MCHHYQVPHPGVLRHILQYDWRPDLRFWVRVVMCDIGSLSGVVVRCAEVRESVVGELFARS